MDILAGALVATIFLTLTGPRQAGRFLAKIVIGFRAQMRDEGEA